MPRKPDHQNRNQATGQKKPALRWCGAGQVTHRIRTVRQDTHRPVKMVTPDRSVKIPHRRGVNIY